MKLSGRHTLSPQSLLLVAACVTCDAFKPHGLSFHEKVFVSDMEGAASVAQFAYQQQQISTNTWKALSNVSCFMEAARSAGLAWTESDAQDHLVLTANGLKSQLAKSASGGPGKAPTYAGMSGMIDDDTKDDLVGEAAGATLTMVTSWIQTGEPPSVEEIATAAAGLAITAIGMFNPLLGAVAGMAFSLVSGLLWPQDPNDTPMNRMYRQIMDEVGIAIDSSQAQQAIGDIKLELQAVMDELQWMPDMLGGVNKEAKPPSEDQARILLTYNIMIQHDLAKMSYKIQNSDRASAKPSAANNFWSAAMFPLAEQLFLLQSNLLFDIAAHEVVTNVDAASSRILAVSENWKTWIAQNTYKAHVASAEQTNQTLGWTLSRGDFRDMRDGKPYGRQTRKTCSIGGLDACTIMKCPAENTKIGPCHSTSDIRLWKKAWCGESACYNSNAFFFYWQYLGPRLQKLQFQVEKMITTLEMKGFEKLGDGFCSETRYAFSQENAAKACAEKCNSEKACNFFTYRPSNKVCSRYGKETCVLKDIDGGHETYRRGIAGFEYMNPGYCTSKAYTSSTDVKQKEDCAAKCRELPNCKFFAYRAKSERCNTFDSETCDLKASDSDFETYRRGSSQAKYSGKPLTRANLKHRFRGRCKGDEGMFGNGDSPLYHDRDVNDRPSTTWGTDRYYSMVVQAWIRCFSRDSRTKYVSVWKDGGYRCFKHNSKCEQDDDHGTRTYELKNWGPFN